MINLKSFIFLEKAFTIISLIIYSGGILSVILSGGASPGDNVVVTTNSSLIQLLFLLNYTVSFVLIILRWKKVIQIISKDRYITLLLGLSIISYLWSSQPSVTLVRNIAMIGSTLFGVYLATRYTLKEQLHLLGLTFGIVIILSLLFILGLPKYGIMSGIHTGKWRGIYTHKNVLGRMMVLSISIFLINGFQTEYKNKFFIWGGIIFSIILLLMCKSSSSLLNTLIMIIGFFGLYSLRLRYELLFPVLFIIIIIGQVSLLWFVNNVDIIFDSLGKDASLTGRAPLWDAVLDMIWQQPWLGYGFGVFWNGWDSECAYVWRLIRWEAPNAHNGFLDIWVDLGLLGLSIYLLGFFANFWKGLALIRMGRTTVSFWPILYMTYFWLANQTESSLLKQNEIYWVLYVAVILSMISLPQDLKNQQTI